MRPANPLLVIVDPVARRRDAESTRIAVDVLSAAEPVKIVTPSAQQDLDRALTRCARGRAVVIGSDGMLRAVVGSLRHGGRLADSTLGLVPVGEHQQHARGCCVAGALGLPATPAEAARVARGPVFRWLDLLVDDAGGITLGRARVGLPAMRRPAAPCLAEAEPPLIPRQLGDPWLRSRLFRAGVAARTGLAAGLAGPAVAAATGGRRGGWRLRVEVDGALLCDEDQWVVRVELGAGTTPPLNPPGLSARPWDGGRGLADVLVATADRPRGRFTAAAGAVRTAQARRVRVRGQGFPYASDDQPGGTARLREWTVEPAAWRIASPG